MWRLIGTAAFGMALAAAARLPAQCADWGIMHVFATPAIAAMACFGLMYSINVRVFGIEFTSGSVPADLALQIATAYWFVAMGRDRRIALTLHALVVITLYVGNALKINTLGGPIVPDDRFALAALLLIAESWQRVAIILPLALISLLFMLNLNWHRPVRTAVWGVAPVLIVIAASHAVAHLDRLFGHSDWNPLANYLGRGAAVNTFHEIARALSEPEQIIPDAELLALSEEVGARGVTAAATQHSGRARNVHLILLESFWDPSVLGTAQFSRDPLAPEFRALWEEAGSSTALSPVFGGYTANAEFEVLCGFPVVEASVKFERRLTNDAPCLPRILRDLGYTTVASHPNTAVFWNRVNAYRRVGFEHYWSKKHFILDDLNGEFLSDASLYAQVFNRLGTAFGPNPSQPIFNYIVTFSGHLPFALSDMRPLIVASASKVDEVVQYANAIWYKSKETADMINWLRHVDPDSVIAAFGDHLPFLGEQRAGYLESGFLPESQDAFTAEDYIRYYSTPLIVIDGQAGGLKVGAVPLYSIPSMILDLLGMEGPTLMDVTRTEHGVRIRPAPGMLINLFGDGSSQLCLNGTGSPACINSFSWLQRTERLSRDVFIGKQIVLKVLAPASPSIAVEEPAQTTLGPL